MCAETRDALHLEAQTFKQFMSELFISFNGTSELLLNVYI